MIPRRRIRRIIRRAKIEAIVDMQRQRKAHGRANGGVYYFLPKYKSGSLVITFDVDGTPHYEVCEDCRFDRATYH